MCVLLPTVLYPHMAVVLLTAVQLCEDVDVDAGTLKA